ncbi:MAG: antibiotic biosynthesis monooxygenase family protein [Pseudomonadota bacterium]
MKKLIAIVMAVGLSLGTAPSQADETENVVLINTFTVPVEKIDEAVAMWELARDFLKLQPGYVSTKLHRSISPEAKYLLINVAEWESTDAFKAATTLMRREAELPRIEGVIPNPGLYTVIRE